MSILVVVRNEKAEQVEESPTVFFQNLVSWENRWRFPMLGFVDPLGNTVLNRLQVRALVGELTGIRDAIARAGVTAAILDIGADEVEDSMRILNWDLEDGLTALVEDLLRACEAALERPHRYLWFLGD